MFQESYIRKVVLLVGVAATIALLAYTYFALTQARQLSDKPVSISVVGKGEVFAKPDIANFSFSVNAKEADASTAQTKSAEAVNAIMAYLKEKGVAEKDIKTEGYNLNPRYEYPQVVCTGMGYCPPAGEPKLIGYEITQTIAVKVRKTDDLGMLVTGVGELGATNVSGPSFTIDDDTALKTQAREKAIADAREQAETLAKNLNVRLVKMIGFWEDQGSYPVYSAMGGNMMRAEAAYDMKAVAPEVPVGENTISSRVTIMYEIR